uniref:HNH endonuclease signature motif containing protein n=1 Tax=Sediminibacterium sp. TaxID=1917865 RepID=UPI003F694E61
DDIIKAEYLNIPIKRLAKNINKSNCYVLGRLKKLGLIIPPEIIANRITNSRIKPGHIPKNKGLRQSEYMSQEMIDRTIATRFKKGQIPHNAIGFKDGDIVTRYAHKERNAPPYKWIRIGKGKWEMYHVNLWKQHNGNIPNGHIIVFKDKNTMNVRIENLECITKKENMLRNSIHQYPEELKKTIQTLSIITRKINRHEKQNQ